MTNARKYVFEYFFKFLPMQISYNFKPVAIKIYKDFAVIYGHIIVFDKNGVKIAAGRIGHFCVKQGGKWLMIASYSGGSSAN